MEVKYVKSSLFLYLHRIHTVTFLSFRAYNIDNQLITDTKAKTIKPGKKSFLPGFLSVRLIDDGYLLQQFWKLEKLHTVAALDEDVVVVRLCFLDGSLYLFYIMELAVAAWNILELVTYQPDILQAGCL